ncbi:hypothetical protein [Saccharopolyspora tripterygii]
MTSGREYLGEVRPSPVPDVTRVLRVLGLHALAFAGVAALIGWSALAICLALAGFALVLAPSRW